MSAPIDFYFDFGSPYGYIASTQVDEMAARFGREVAWRPFLIGVAMQQTGSKPLTERGFAERYARHDFERSARMYGVPLRFPDVFPVSPVAASRAFYWLADQDPPKAKRFAAAVYRAYWADNVDIGAPDTVADIAARAGIERASLRAALDDGVVKARLRDETAAALERGVFGSPQFIVDGEAFWGADRLPHVERWLESGGW